jgi:hypothetical protein
VRSSEGTRRGEGERDQASSAAHKVFFAPDDAQSSRLLLLFLVRSSHLRSFQNCQSPLSSKCLSEVRLQCQHTLVSFCTYAVQRPSITPSRVDDLGRRRKLEEGEKKRGVRAVEVVLRFSIFAPRNTTPNVVTRTVARTPWPGRDTQSDVQYCTQRRATNCPMDPHSVVILARVS